MIKVIFIGDIFGNQGVRALKQMMPSFRKKYAFDFCIANAENVSNGKGLIHIDAKTLFHEGVDALTMGNHVWSRMEIHNYIESEKRVLVPANLPADLPGYRYIVLENNGKSIAVLCLLGKVFMDGGECPFRTMDNILPEIKTKSKAVLVDIHAEATSEKVALGWYLDGRVSAVIGTHTHVQTADERILERGTAILCDAGMTGPYNGIIGSDIEGVLNRFLYKYPTRLSVAKGQVQFNGVYLEIDELTGKTTRIERIHNVMD